MGQEAPSGGLGASARAALVWGGGFTLLRDVVQFATMLCLVRLLTPRDYGSMALAQSVVGFISVFSFGTFITHALQIRDPSEVDWQAQFTSGAVLNTTLFAATLLIAWGLSLTESYHEAALPLAGLSTVLLIEIAATLRHRMLEAHHEWKRFRLLLLVGIILGAVAGLGVALLGGGAWALVVQVPLFGLPAAVDLFWGARWRPDWSWSWQRYRGTARFGTNRIGAAAIGRGRFTAENATLTGTYDLAALGIFTRSVGLATLLVGRLGAVALGSLYPVITRADPGSPRFRRYAGLVIRAVCWGTLGGGAFLALSAEGIVLLIYGDQWLDVVPLLPLAAAGVGLLGISTAVGMLLLANNSTGSALFADATIASAAIGLALLLVPLGIDAYLAGLTAVGLAGIAGSFFLLWLRDGISGGDIARALLPAIIAGAVAVGLVLLARGAVGMSDMPRLRIALDLPLFAVTYLGVLRLVFPNALRDIVAVAPSGARLARVLRLSPTQPTGLGGTG